MPLRRPIAYLLLLLLAAPALAADREEVDPVAALRAAVAAYEPSQAVESKARAADAFFLFESSKLDRQLAASRSGLYREIEARWIRLVEDIGAGRPAAEIRSQGAAVAALVEDGSRSLHTSSSVFFDALLIILREGFEAILVVSALAAYLTRTGQRAQRPYLYGGAVAAVVASFALWFAARTAFAMSGSAREALEGGTMLFATAVLFWVSYWLVSKAGAERWQAFVRSRVERAVGRGALLGFGVLAFVVVFREGFETVLFYEALAARAATPSSQTLVAAGFVLGASVLVLFYGAFVRLGPKIPLGPFFAITGALLYFMAFKFAGGGVAELQEAGWIARTRVDLVPDSAFLSGWFGISPYLEPLVAQAVLAAAAVVALLVQLARSGRSVEPLETSPRPRMATNR